MHEGNYNVSLTEFHNSTYLPSSSTVDSEYSQDFVAVWSENYYINKYEFLLGGIRGSVMPFKLYDLLETLTIL